MTHDLFIAVHAAAATVALVSAVLALRNAAFAALHAVSVALMAVSLGPSLWLGRGTTPVPLSVVFLGLLILSVVMSYRAVRAWRARPARGSTPARPYVAALGFNVIGLVTGLVTVGVLRLGWGGLAVTTAAVGIPVLGHLLLRRVEEALCAPETVGGRLPSAR